jgi:hypothetical protein
MSVACNWKFTPKNTGVPGGENSNKCRVGPGTEKNQFYDVVKFYHLESRS